MEKRSRKDGRRLSRKEILSLEILRLSYLTSLRKIDLSWIYSWLNINSIWSLINISLK
jgi:hypothetical protein